MRVYLPFSLASSPSPVRQLSVLTFTHQVRFWQLRSPEMFNEVNLVVVDRISFHYEQHAALVLGQDHLKSPTSNMTPCLGKSVDKASGTS